MTLKNELHGADHAQEIREASIQGDRSSYARSFILLFVIILTMIFTPIWSMPVPFYHYQMENLPTGGLFLNEMDYFAYQLFIPSGWYGLVPPLTKIGKNRFLLDAQNWYQSNEIPIPLRGDYWIDAPSELRLLFFYWDINYYYIEFLPTGYVYIVREENIDEVQKIKLALRWAQWEILEVQHSYELSSENDITVKIMEGIGETSNNELMYISVASFNRDVGLVVIPIISPLSQKNVVQMYMNEIVNSLDFSE